MVGLKKSKSLADRVAALEQRMSDLEDRKDAASHRSISTSGSLTTSRYRNKNEILYDLSAKKKVAVSKYNGAVLVHVRDYYTHEGKLKPGAGITLNVQ